MLAGVADALDHAHRQGVIHRDLKPGNLLLSSDGRLSLNDFGLARMLEQPGMTMSGEFVGTPAYMSPEQIAAGRTPVDHRTDIYSLGATLYELLTLQRPFPGKQRDQVLASPHRHLFVGSHPV
jgi:serine/threonine protein kinase